MILHGDYNGYFSLNYILIAHICNKKFALFTVLLYSFPIPIASCFLHDHIHY